jgi:uncharacterized iron-regulated membrane protein
MSVSLSTRSWFRVHSFTGVITGMMLFVICFSGSWAVVSQELDWLVNPALRVTPGETRASWGELAAVVEKAYPGAELLWLEAPRHAAATATALIDAAEAGLTQVHLNPYTAEVTGQSSFVDFQRFLRNFHMSLFQLGGVGLYLVCAFSITLWLSLISALSFYRRWWTRGFRFRGGGRALLSETHKLVGLWSLWFLALMALTGTWYLIEAARLDLGDGKFSHAGIGGSAVHRVPEPQTPAIGPPLPMDRLIALIRAARPELDIRLVGPGLSHAGALYVEGDAGHLLVRNRANFVHIDTASGEILYRQDATALPAYWRWSETADPLHFGDFGGLWSKLIWFVFGLLLSGLVFSGTWLHARRLAASRGGQARHRWPGTWAAITVTVLVLGASVDAGLGQAREAYGTTVDGLRQLPTLTPGVRGLILAWTGITIALIGLWIGLLWRARPTSPGGSSAGSDRVLAAPWRSRPPRAQNHWHS